MTTKHENLKTFLTKHRAKINPEDYGFTSGRRRVKGLRREEVAQLAAINVSWYTWLEQGREISISRAAINRIGTVLKLTNDEQEYLNAIVFGNKPALEEQEEVSEELKALIRALEPNPAFIRRENMDIEYWNEAASKKIFDWSTLPKADRNSLKLMFLNDEYKRRIPQWEQAAKNTIASFRSYFALATDKSAFKAVLDDLKSRSELFCQMWQDYEVKRIREGEKSVLDDKGTLRHYKYVSLKPEHYSNTFVIYYIESKEKLSNP